MTTVSGPVSGNSVPAESALAKGDGGAVAGDLRTGDHGPGESQGRTTFGALRPWALANLVAQSAIILTGGLVRLTGSGLGCPTWPQCVPGSFVPVAHQAQGWHRYIEFGNRMLTPLLVAVAAAVFVVTILELRRRPLARSMTILGIVPLAGVLAQAVLGGVTVLLKLSPITVAIHYLLSASLVAAATWLWLATAAPQRIPAAPLAREVRWLSTALALSGTAVVALGTVVTGSGPHSGDAQRPARFGFDPRTVSWIHADVVWLFLGLVLALILVGRLVDAGPQLRRWTQNVLWVSIAQAVVGYVQYATGLPVALVSVHLVGSALLIIAVTGVVFSVHRAGPGVRIA